MLGESGKNLMKQFQSHTKSTVVFTPSHWMTTGMMILYFKQLKGLFPGKKIGVIYDYAPSHYSAEILEWINEENAR